MGFFGCSHPKWSKWTKPHNGYKQHHCLKCGRVKRKRVSQFWCQHRYGRNRKSKIIVCRKCGKPKPVRK